MLAWRATYASQLGGGVSGHGSEVTSAALHDLTDAYPTLDQLAPHASSAPSHAHSHMGGRRYVPDERLNVLGSS
jgi:hypothetical protein